MKIGVFDSGIGGITVLTELRKRLPQVDYVYLGDTANVPYGPKSPSQISRLSVDCVKTLKDRGIAALVVACNTASSQALPAIKQAMGSLPVFGVVEPGVEAALAAAGAMGEGAPILVLATRATIRSQAYANALRTALGPPLKGAIFEQACPVLVPMIEEGWIDHPILHQTILEYVRPYLSEPKPGVALLGCTHYPWIHAAFQKALPGWKIVDSSWAIASALERSALFGQPTQGKSKVEWIFTDPEAVPEFARRLLGD